MENFKKIYLQFFLFPIYRDYLGPLYEAIRTKNVDAAREWSYLDHWTNMQALIQATTMN